MVVYNNNCFGCGKGNPNGLQLEFVHEKDVCRTKFRPSATYQGYDGILHGGIISTVLDEVMGKCLTDLGIAAVTGQLEVKFKKPVKIQQELLAEAKIVNNRGRVIEMKSQILLEDGTVAATGKGKFVRMKE